MRSIRTALVALLCGTLACVAQAAPVDPTFDSFSDIDATFGGNGIPTDPTAITTVTGQSLGNEEIILGLRAHQRFANAPLGNDGNGTFSAFTGTNSGTPGEPGTASTWNFAFFVEIAGGSTFETLADDVLIELLYDLDPGVDTDQSDLGSISLRPFGTGLSVLQGSQNPTFGFLSTGGMDVTAPTFATFDANVAGEYSFALVVSDANGELGRSAINVNVAVPGPGALGLLALALGAVALRRRRSPRA